MHARLRLMVIDDDPMFRSLLVSLLRRDYLVSIAGEGSEGFQKALEHQPDIAIVDIQMPGWDGLKTLRAFRMHPQLRHVKVVMLTSDASKETVLAAIHGGAHDYVIKTAFTRDEFFHKLERVASGAVALPPTDDPPAVAAPAAPNAVESIAVEAAAPAVVDAAPTLHEVPQEILDAWE